MKYFKKGVLLFLVLLLSLCLFACEEKEPEEKNEEESPIGIVEHEHDFCVLQYDANYHWYRCRTCAATSEKELHKRAGTQCEKGCGMRYSSEGLVFSRQDDDTFCLTNASSCIDAEVYIAEYHNGLPISSIGEGAFKNNLFVDYVEFSEHSQIKRIEKEAFRGSNVSYVELPDSVEYIGEYAYAYCTSLTTFEPGRNLTEIGDYAFAYCKQLSEPEIDEVVRLGENAFLKQAQKQLAVPKVTIDNYKATWSGVPNAVGYEYTIYNADETILTTGTVPADERTITMAEGQYISIVAKGTGATYADSEPSEKIMCVLDILEKIKSSLSSVGDLIRIYNSTDDRLSAELSLGAYFRDGVDTESVGINAKANLNAFSPSFLLELAFNDQRVIGATYVNNIAYIDDVIDQFYIDLSGLDQGENAFFKQVLHLLGKSYKLDYEPIEKMIFDTIEKIGGPLINLGLRSLLEITTSKDGKEVSFGITCGTITLLVDILDKLNIADVDADMGDLFMRIRYAMADPILKLIYPKLSGFDVHWLDWQYLRKKIADADVKSTPIKVTLSYDDDRIINGVHAVVDLAEIDKKELDYSIGFDLTLPLFSTTTLATIPTPRGYEPKELTIDLGGYLSQRGVGADAHIVIPLSKMFASNNEVMVMATADVKRVVNSETKTAQVKAYIDSYGAYLDLEDVCKLFGMDEQTAKHTKYKRRWGFSLADFINSGGDYDVMRGNTPQNAKIVVDGESVHVESFIWQLITQIGDILLFSRTDDEKLVNFVSCIYNLILKRFVNPPLPDKESDWMIKVADFHQLYSKIDLHADTLGEVFLRFADAHKKVAYLLDETVRRNDETFDDTVDKDGIIHKSTKTLCVDLVQQDSADLLDYLAAFVVIPKVENGERKYGPGVMQEVNDEERLADWIEALMIAFDMGLFQNVNVNTLMKTIVGDYVGSVIDQGVYLEAKAIEYVDETDEYDLEAEVAFRRNAEDEEGYFSIHAGIGARDKQDLMFDVFDLSDFIPFSEIDPENNEFFIRNLGINIFLQIFNLEGEYDEVVD